MDFEHSDSHDVIGVDTDETGAIVSTANQVLDYIHWSMDLVNMCLWDFVSCINKLSKNSDGILRQADCNISLETKKGQKPNMRAYLLEPHPQAKIHIFRHRDKKNWLIPIPTGPKIYRRDWAAVYENYCRLLLIFFKPWRNCADLQEQYTCFSDSFTPETHH